MCVEHSIRVESEVIPYYAAPGAQSYRKGFFFSLAFFRSNVSPPALFPITCFHIVHLWQSKTVHHFPGLLYSFAFTWLFWHVGSIRDRIPQKTEICSNPFFKSTNIIFWNNYFNNLGPFLKFPHALCWRIKSYSYCEQFSTCFSAFILQCCHLVPIHRHFSGSPKLSCPSTTLH